MAFPSNTAVIEKLSIDIEGELFGLEHGSNSAGVLIAIRGVLECRVVLECSKISTTIISGPLQP